MGIRALGNSGVITETDLISKLIIKVEEEPNIVLANTEDTFALVSEPKNKESLLISLTDTTGSRFLKNTDFALTKDGTTGISSVILNTPVSQSTEVIVKHFKEIGSDVVGTTELSDFLNVTPEDGDSPVYDGVLGKYVPRKQSVKNNTNANVLNPVLTDGDTSFQIFREIDETTDQVILFKNGAPLIKDSDFTISGDMISLSSPVISTDSIYGWVLGNFTGNGYSIQNLNDIDSKVPENYDIMYYDSMLAKWTMGPFNTFAETASIQSLSDIDSKVPENYDIMYYDSTLAKWTMAPFNTFVETASIQVGGGSGYSIEVTKIVSDGIISQIDLDSNIDVFSVLVVHIDGLYQPESSYTKTLNGNVLDFGSIIPAGLSIEVRHYKAISSGLIEKTESVSNGSTDNITIPTPITSTSELNIYVGGLYQPDTTYTTTLNSNVVTFSSIIPLDATITVIHYI